MNDLIKTYRRNVGYYYSLPYGYRSYNYRKQPQNYTIKVNGDGTVTAKPDQAIVSLGVVVEDEDVQNAQQENTLISNQIIDGLKKMGITEDDIETTTYTIKPVYDYSDGKKIFRGYEVKHIFEITIKDISKIGVVIDTAVQNGANVINIIEFTISNPEFYYKQALEKAVLNARKKAEVIANSLGVNINEIPLRVIEETTIAERKFLYVPKLATDGMTTSIQEGKIKIISKITALFQYESFN